VDVNIEEMLIRVRCRVYGEDLEPIRYPADWWQALKDRWFPAWLRRRYPVVYTAIDVAAMYPDLRVGHHRGYTTVVKVRTDERGG